MARTRIEPYPSPEAWDGASLFKRATRLRRGLKEPGLVEVELSFMRFGRKGTTREGAAQERRTWAPLAQLALYAPFDVIRGGRRVARNDDETPVDIVFHPTGLVDAHAGAAPGDPVHEPCLLPPESLAAMTSPAFFCRAQPNDLMVRTAELFRFYFARAPFLVEQLARRPDAAPGADLVDPSRTGYVGDRVFQIAPLSPRCTRGDAVMLALVLTDPALSSMVKNVVRGLAAPQAKRDCAAISCLPPPRRTHWRVRLLEYAGSLTFSPRKRPLEIIEILADHTPPAFDELIILSDGSAGALAVASDAKAPTRAQPRPGTLPAFFEQSLRVTEIANDVPRGARTQTIPSPLPSLQEAFPALAERLVRVAREGRRVERHVIAAGVESTETRVVGSLYPRRRGRGAPSLAPRPARPAVDRVAADPEAQAKPSLLTNPPTPAPAIVALKTEIFDPRLRAFADAVRRLDDSDRASLVFETISDAFNPEVVEALELPLSWSGAAHAPGSGRGRRCLVAQFRVMQPHVYALDVEDAGLAFGAPICLVRARDRRKLTLPDFGCLLHYFCERRGTTKGTAVQPDDGLRGGARQETQSGRWVQLSWPRADEFGDVLVKRLLHTEKRSNVARLSEALWSEAEKLAFEDV